MVIEQWLQPNNRTENHFPFDVTDVEETSEIPTAAELVSIMTEAYWGNEYLSGVAARYGHQEVSQVFIAGRATTGPFVRRGDFGEAVTAEFLRDVEGYHIPVMKLRYKIGANQTLPGTDCVALRFDRGRLSEVALVESKFRSSGDNYVAVEGATQLKKDSDRETPEILPFIARILRNQGDPITELVEDYIFGRDLGIENYILTLIYEQTLWSETVLVNLNDAEVELKPLHVYILKIAQLRNMADATFSGLGLEVIADDQ